jgi:hypothetical protein
MKIFLMSLIISPFLIFGGMIVYHTINNIDIELPTPN